MMKFKEEYDKNGILIEKQNLVRKHNDLVQAIRLNLTETEQKTIIYAVSKIKPENKITDWIELDLNKYCKACGIDYDNGGNVRHLKKTLQGLRDKSQWMKFGTSERPVSWFYDVELNTGSNLVKVLFNPLLENSLYGLNRDFLQYRLEMALPLDGKYTVALYEYFKSKLGSKRKTFDFNLKTENFKELLGIDKLKTYDNFGKLRMKIIEPAFEEIEEKTDIFVQWTPVKTGRGGKILVMRFDITYKNNYTYDVCE